MSIEHQSELFGRMYQVMQDRQKWETKQRLYYKMRHDGIARRNKPFPTAADLHLALIDESITKLKPFWLAQALGSDRLATFIAMKQQVAKTSESAADFFDFELKQRTEFTRKLETVVDTMLLRGRGVMKSYVDPFKNHKLIFEPVDPLFILMRETANDFEDADEWVHVRQMSVHKFKRNRLYEQAHGDMAKIQGGKDAGRRFQDKIRSIAGPNDSNFEMIFADKELREGITHSPRTDTIVIWEHYVASDSGWTVYEYCPLDLSVQLRKPRGVPYKVQGEISCPFYSFVMEVKDEGWYSPRGVAEKIAAHELYGCKVWNEKADAITFYNRPLLTSETPIANPGNYRWAPGEYMPGNLRGVQMGQAGFSFDQEINFARGEAEQMIQMPDFGIEQTTARGGKPRTATENERIAALQNTGQNHNGMIFRYDLCKLFRHAWGLMLQYKRTQLTYFITDDLKTVPEQALHDEYLILPGGGTDDWDRAKRLMKAGARYDRFRGVPNVNQDELTRDVFAAEDARLPDRLLLPMNQKIGIETEDEAAELSLMLATHFPAQVTPGEDHLTRVKVIVQFLMAQGQISAPVDPLARQRIQEHLAVHLKYLKETQPEAFKQAIMLISQLETTPMPGGGPTATGTAPMPGAAAAGPGTPEPAPMPAMA